MKEIFFCKSKVIFTLIYLCIAIGAVVFVNNDAFLYKKTVAEVQKSKITDRYIQKSQNMKKEKYYTQTLTVKILNGKFKGKKAYVTNSYTKSEVKTVRYEKKDRVFVSIAENNGDLVGKVTGFKSDFAVLLVILIFIYAMIIVAGLRGILFVLASVVNVGLLYAGLDLYAGGMDIMYICYAMIFLFTIVSLVCISGLKKSTAISITSVFIVVAVVGIIYKIVLACTEAPDYIMMEYVSGPNDLNRLFFMEILAGCLGAVMDVAVSVSETACVLKNNTPDMPVKTFINSMREFGRDITGTMVNILFYSYFCGTVPMILVQMKNKYKFNYICRFDLPFELTRFLTGSIGIVITIPVTAVVAWFVLYRMKAMKLHSSRNED